MTVLPFSGFNVAIVWALWITLGAGLTSTAEPPVTAMAISPDGRHVVTGSQAGLKVWRWPDLTMVREVESQLIDIHAVAFSPSGNQIAVAGGIPDEQGLAEILDWPTLQNVSRHVFHGDTIESIDWRDDEVFVTGSLDRSVAVWDRNLKAPTRVLSGHSKGVTTVRFLPGGTQMVSGSIDQSVRLWEVDTGRLIRTLNNHTGSIHDGRVSPSAGNRLPMVATVSEDRTVRLWQPTIGRMVRFVRLETTPLSVDWVSSGNELIVSCRDGTILSVNPQTAEVTGRESALDGWAYVMSVHPTEPFALVGGQYGQLKKVSLVNPR